MGMVGAPSHSKASTTDVVTEALPTAVLPSNCGNPFIDIQGFISFYDQAIAYLAVNRGSADEEVTKLFAVSELRGEFDRLVPNPAAESAIDRLIVAQLCQYRKIRDGKTLGSGRTAGSMDPIEASDDALRAHLVKIAPKLYQDVRRYMVDVLAELARTDLENNRLSAHRKEIQKARRLGRAKVSDLIE